jgi:hypothetical protein
MVAGRPSAASVAGPRIPGEQMAAPIDMPEDQQTEWEAITSALPSNWIQAENAPLLRQLCAHTNHARVLNAEAARLLALAKQAGDTKEGARAWQRFRTVVRSHGAQTEKILQLSRALRLTPSSRYRPEPAERRTRRESASPRPWLDWGGDRHQ